MLSRKMADEGDVDVEENREVKSTVKPSRPTRKANKSATLKQIILKNEKNALVRRVCIWTLQILPPSVKFF